MRDPDNNTPPAPDLAFADLGAPNWRGVWTLYSKEVRRFANVYTQTILAPMVTTLLFLAVFTLALGRAVEIVGGVPYTQFLAPGLIMMAMTQNAFANTSSSIVIAKVQGNIVDTLMPPLTAHELTLAIAMGGATRGLVVGAAVAVAMSLFADLPIHNVGWILYFGFMASLLLSLMGVAGGVWSQKFDHIAAVTNFVVTPLAFLSGTFYSIERLPDAAQKAAQFNPFFHMIDGFRYGFIGNADGDVVLGALMLLGANAVMWVICWWMFATGYKLKA